MTHFPLKVSFKNLCILNSVENNYSVRKSWNIQHNLFFQLLLQTLNFQDWVINIRFKIVSFENQDVKMKIAY